MRKTNRKMILGGILAATMILGGTGYAYWTDTLKVTATATTGDLDMTFADMGLYAQYRDEVLQEHGQSLMALVVQATEVGHQVSSLEEQTSATIQSLLTVQLTDTTEMHRSTTM